MTDPVIHLLVIGGRLVADIHQEKNRTELFGIMKIALDHFSPFFLLCRRNLGVAVARQVYEIHCFINIIKIDRLCFSRLCTGSCQGLAVHQTIDQGGFPYI